MIKLQLPLHFQATKKKTLMYSLNEFLIAMGTTRAVNSFYQYKAKKHLVKLVAGLCVDLEPINPACYPVDITITIYRGSNRLCDMGNFSIIEKFTTDSLVANGILAEDNWKYIQSVKIQDGGLNKENPHAEYKIG